MAMHRRHRASCCPTTAARGISAARSRSTTSAPCTRRRSCWICPPGRRRPERPGARRFVGARGAAGAVAARIGRGSSARAGRAPRAVAGARARLRHRGIARAHGEQRHRRRQLAPLGDFRARNRRPPSPRLAMRARARRRPRPNAWQRADVTAAVDITGLARRFGAIDALAGVDLRVEPGEFFGLLGPNGAGKTTLISILAGLTRADRGSVRVLGHDVVTDYRVARRLARRRAAGARVRPVLLGARDAADPERLFRHTRQRRLDRRDPASPRPDVAAPTPTCARCRAA